MPSPHSASMTTASKVSSPPTNTILSSSTSYPHSASPPSALPSKPFAPTRTSFSQQTSVPASAPFGYQPSTSWSNHPIYDNPAPRSSHISSAVRQAPRGHQPRPSFEAASLPRTSSLLPPPNLTSRPATGTFDSAPQLQQAPVFRDPFGGGAYAASTTATPGGAFNIARIDSEPYSDSRRPSRSNSVGRLNEGFRNLNRWSASTASSRASPPPSRKSSLGRRMSVDTIALQSQELSGFASASGAAQHPFQYQYNQQYQSPRKLQKQPPHQASGLNPAARHGSAARVPARTPPPASLPPIVPLSSLERDVREASPLAAGQPQRQWTPDNRFTTSTPTPARDARPVTPTETVLSTQVEVEGSPVAGDSKMSYNGYVPAQQSGIRGHSRNRSQNAKGSGDSSGSRNPKPPSQKAMLSKALQKANIAVQLDNARNVFAARESYGEACDLLHQVLMKTAGEEDRRKLEAIKQTYTVRIEELDQLAARRRHENRPLPKDPSEADIVYRAARDEVGGNEAGAVFGKATVTRASQAEVVDRRPSIPTIAPPQPGGYDRDFNSLPTVTSKHIISTQNASTSYSAQSPFSKTTADRNVNGLSLQPPSTSQYIPAPLSPRRPLSPSKAPPERALPEEPGRLDVPAAIERQGELPSARGHRRGASNGSVSWLDPIDESGGSAESSVHSRSSSMGIRRKHVRMASGDTEAAFDAALDDAIEAAYDEGYEPVDDSTSYQEEESSEDIVAKALRKVELARERVRATQQEALVLANERERRLREALEMQEEDDIEEDGNEDKSVREQGSGVFYDGDDSEEEERILEEMTWGYSIDDFTFRPSTKASLPRASDSSEMTNRTWHTSMGSNPPTATTMLSSVSENTIVPGFAKGLPDALPPPPTGSLPPPPQRRGTGPTPGLAESPPKEGVRARRLSGQNPKQLKIETAKASKPPAPGAAAGVPVTATATTSSSQLKSGGYIAQQRQALSAGPNRTAGPFSRSPGAAPSPGETAPPTPPLPPGSLQDGENRSGSPSVPRPGLRKNFSSSSLRSMKSRNMSVSALDDASDFSPATPMSNQFAAANAKLPALPSLPTPVAAAFKERLVSAGGTGGLYLFEGDFHSPNSPGLPNPLSSDAPVPLEPCPTDTMLRPFWLMRCIYQTLSHPRGGYISNKLFVPRDVWKVKGVKLKNVEDKIANCDYLTAALLKLAKVDTFDADEVLDEMQSLEVILEQVQTALTRKLGSEVGVQSSQTMFKDASTGPDDATSGNVPRSASVSGKSSFSWRRLRSKNSSAGLQSAYLGNARKESLTEGGAKEGATLASLPMTSHPTSRPTKRDVTSVQFSGPNAVYMGALARLMDAAQTIDQIARQVEDPGLRHADKTQVGLELCTRHAAEFFAFYICRFVLSDIALLLDKFVKRGSEWVVV